MIMNGGSGKGGKGSVREILGDIAPSLKEL
jgi:hypothetical protein